MLDVQLTNAGFYAVTWPQSSETTPGKTYVRPGARESVRVFLPAASAEVEVYAGDLKNGRLVYRGPEHEAARLPLLAGEN